MKKILLFIACAFGSLFGITDLERKRIIHDINNAAAYQHALMQLWKQTADKYNPGPDSLDRYLAETQSINSAIMIIEFLEGKSEIEKSWHHVAYFYAKNDSGNHTLRYLITLAEYKGCATEEKINYLFQHAARNEAFDNVLYLIQRFNIMQEPRERKNMLRDINKHEANKGTLPPAARTLRELLTKQGAPDANIN